MSVGSANGPQGDSWKQSLGCIVPAFQERPREYDEHHRPQVDVDLTWPDQDRCHVHFWVNIFNCEHHESSQLTMVAIIGSHETSNESVALHFNFATSPQLEQLFIHDAMDVCKATKSISFAAAP
jgi:hypothetical protein